MTSVLSGPSDEQPHLTSVETAVNRLFQSQEMNGEIIGYKSLLEQMILKRKCFRGRKLRSKHKQFGELQLVADKAAGSTSKSGQVSREVCHDDDNVSVSSQTFATEEGQVIHAYRNLIDNMHAVRKSSIPASSRHSKGSTNSSCSLRSRLSKASPNTSRSSRKRGTSLERSITETILERAAEDCGHTHFVGEEKGEEEGPKADFILQDLVFDAYNHISTPERIQDATSRKTNVLSPIQSEEGDFDEEETFFRAWGAANEQSLPRFDDSVFPQQALISRKSPAIFSTIGTSQESTSSTNGNGHGARLTRSSDPFEALNIRTVPSPLWGNADAGSSLTISNEPVPVLQPRRYSSGEANSTDSSLQFPEDDDVDNVNDSLRHLSIDRFEDYKDWQSFLDNPFSATDSNLLHNDSPSSIVDFELSRTSKTRVKERP